MTDIWQVSTTTATREDAEMLGRSAVQQGLAARAQILGPATTMTWRDGEYLEIEEWQLTFITLDSRFDDLHLHLLDNHTWDQPQVLGVPVPDVAADYKTWISHPRSQCARRLMPA